MIRLVVFGEAVLAVVFFVASIYSGSVRREKLEKKWDREVKTGDRDAYVEAGMQAYDKGLRKKFLWLIFVIPVLVIIGLVYLTNFS